jgi:hypothetical protein
MSARLFAFAAAACVLASPAAAAERNFTVTDFRKIRIDGPYTVQLKTGVSPFARVTGSSAAIDGISLEVQGQTLIVHKNPSGWGGYPGAGPGPVEISVGTHDLTNIWINGAGNLKANAVDGPSLDISLGGSGTIAIGQVTVDKLSVGLAGTGTAMLAGTANEASAMIRGTSSLNARSLTVKNAVIGADGAAVVALTAINTAKVNTQGMTTVDLGGNPSCTLNAAGSAVVTGCRKQPN